MKKHIILIIIVLLYSSCRSGLYLVDENYISNVDNKRPYNLSEFDIYVYNICEKIDKEVNNERFCDCRDDFFEIAKKGDLIKVEEVYILKHKSNNLILYLTTFSHKYIESKKGFLNDPNYYQNKLVLDQIEYVYIGSFNKENNWIHFQNPKKGKDMILHYNQQSYPKTLDILKVNIATSDNCYEIINPIKMEDVFRLPISYKLNNDYQINYYENKTNTMYGQKKVANKIYIVSNKGRLEIIFESINKGEKLYKIGQKRIKYRPNYYLIPN